MKQGERLDPYNDLCNTFQKSHLPSNLILRKQKSRLVTWAAPAGSPATINDSIPPSKNTACSPAPPPCSLTLQTQ
jgi:hypothetical protein